MSLVEHAEYELKKAGLFDDDSDYNGMLGHAALEIVKTFSEQGHSGASAAMTIDIVTRLMRYEPLTPLTSNPDEWNRLDDELAPSEPNGLWQSRRRPSTFSRDGGETWYDIHDPTLNNGDVHDREAARWEEVLIGNNVRIGSHVRIKVDAYKFAAAAGLNGAEGRVTAIRNRVIAVRLDDGRVFNHEPDRLQVLKLEQ